MNDLFARHSHPPVAQAKSSRPDETESDLAFCFSLDSFFVSPKQSSELYEDDVPFNQLPSSCNEQTMMNDPEVRTDYGLFKPFVQINIDEMAMDASKNHNQAYVDSLENGCSTHFNIPLGVPERTLATSFSVYARQTASSSLPIGTHGSRSASASGGQHTANDCSSNFPWNISTTNALDILEHQILVSYNRMMSLIGWRQFNPGWMERKNMVKCAQVCFDSSCFLL